MANLIAGGVGLNLTQVRHVVFNDLDWVPTNHWQAEDRAYRIGQQASVTVHYLSMSGAMRQPPPQTLAVSAGYRHMSRGTPYWLWPGYWPDRSLDVSESKVLRAGEKHCEPTYEESDVTCSYPGFEYRGACRHATDLKRALTAGSTPVGFKEVFG